MPYVDGHASDKLYHSNRTIHQINFFYISMLKFEKKSEPDGIYSGRWNDMRGNVRIVFLPLYSMGRDSSSVFVVLKFARKRVQCEAGLKVCKGDNIMWSNCAVSLGEGSMLEM